MPLAVALVTLGAILIATTLKGQTVAQLLEGEEGNKGEGVTPGFNNLITVAATNAGEAVAAGAASFGAALGVNGQVNGDTKGLTKEFMAFLREVAGVLGKPIYITSGRRPGDSDSNHSDGDAGDMRVGGQCGGGTGAGPCANGDEICAAVLIVTGMNPAEARRVARINDHPSHNFSNNRSWKGHSVELGWRTHVGGDHYNHVHAGFDPVGGG